MRLGIIGGIGLASWMWVAGVVWGQNTAPFASTNGTPALRPLVGAKESFRGGEVPMLEVQAVAPSASTTKTPKDDTLRRLEPMTPEQLMEKYGSAGYLLRKSTRRDWVNVVSPFAPSDWGGKPREVFNRDPNLKPGAVLPRSFQKDGIRDEPNLKLIGYP